MNFIPPLGFHYILMVAANTHMANETPENLGQRILRSVSATALCIIKRSSKEYYRTPSRPITTARTVVCVDIGSQQQG